MEKIDRSEWLYQKKWGVFMHFLHQPAGSADALKAKGADFVYDVSDPGKLTPWEEKINNFDVDHFAAQLNEIGAGWCGVTIMQLSRYMIAPNATFDKYTGYKPGEACSRIDFIDRLIKALDKYDIGLMLYFTGDGPSRDPKAKAALQTWDDDERVIHPDFVEKWSNVVKEYSLRYGDKVKAWWHDGMWIGYKDKPELLKMYADAFRAGNPDAAIATNIDSCIDQGNAELVLNPRRGAKYDDFTAGEVVKLGALPYHPFMDGCGARWHILTFLGAEGASEVEGWGTKGCKYKPGWLFDYVDEVHKRGGIITFDIHYEPDGTIDPDQMRALRLLKTL
ncbi:MAG: hypothetical protein IJC36_01740 [Clostridia bacterium]|nr:hypothetical protein [Clostridia bacterium]